MEYESSTVYRVEGFEELDLVRIRNRVLGTNTYIKKIGQTDDYFVVDPGLDKDFILSYLKQNKIHPRWIFNTHAHFDHVGAVKAIQEEFDAQFFVHKKDEKIIKSNNFLMMAIKLKGKVETPVGINYFEEEDFLFQLPDQSDVRMFHVPGHTPGSVVIEYDNLLFTGDTLYAKGLSFPAFPGAKKGELKGSIEKILATFPEDHILLPGHGQTTNLSNCEVENI